MQAVHSRERSGVQQRPTLTAQCLEIVVISEIAWMPVRCGRMRYEHG
jgi:hypothetical protein